MDGRPPVDHRAKMDRSGRDARSGRTRQLVLELLERHRGLHKSELCRLSGRGWGTVGHHVHALMRERLAEVEAHGRLTWVFLPRVARHERAWLVAAQVGSRRTILEALLGAPADTVSGLSRRTDLPAKAVRKHLHSLQHLGVVHRTGGIAAYASAWSLAPGLATNRAAPAAG